MRGRGSIVPFGDFCAVALFEDQLLLRQKIVREHSIQLSNLVQLVEFASGIVTVVADEFTDPGPVLLLHVRTIILVPRPRDCFIKGFRPDAPDGLFGGKGAVMSTTLND